MSDHVERGAQEEQTGTPLTETEIEASQRPPSQPDSATEPGSDGSSVEEGSADVSGAGRMDQDTE